MLLLTETDVEEGAVLTEKLRNLVARQRYASSDGQELSVTISIGIAGGEGGPLRTDDPRPRRGRRDVLGEVARPQPDLHLRRARRGRPGPARPDLGRRAGRWRSRSAGSARDAATASLTSVIAPLPHYRGQPSALIASIVVAMARNLDLPEAEVDRIRIAALLHDVGKVAVPAGHPRQAGGAHVGRVADRSSSIRGSAR